MHKIFQNLLLSINAEVQFDGGVFPYYVAYDSSE